jgi:hypothetical protein
MYCTLSRLTGPITWEKIFREEELLYSIPWDSFQIYAFASEGIIIRAITIGGEVVGGRKSKIKIQCEFVNSRSMKWRRSMSSMNGHNRGTGHVLGIGVLISRDNQTIALRWKYKAYSRERWFTIWHECKYSCFLHDHHKRKNMKEVHCAE